MATLDEQIEALTKRLDERDRAPLAAEVAKAKGLPPGLAKRLRGSTRAELEEDADELLATFPAAAGGSDKETGDGFDPQTVVDAVRRVRGGGAADEEIEKVVDRVRRGF